MDVIDRATPTIIKRYLATLTLKERVGLYSLYAEVACVALPFPSLLSLLSLSPLPPLPLSSPSSPSSSIPSLPPPSTPSIPPSLFSLQQTELRFTSHSLNLTWLADRSACFLEQGGNRDSLRDAWTQCLAGLLEPHMLPDACPTSVRIAWPYAFNRMVKAYAVLDPG